MANLSDENERSRVGGNLTALAFAESVIVDICQINSKRKQEARIITDGSTSKAQATDKIRAIFRVICEIPEKPIDIELRKKREMETEWNFWEKVRKRIERVKLIS